MSVPRRQSIVSDYAVRDCRKDATKSSKGRDQAAYRRRDQQISGDSSAQAEVSRGALASSNKLSASAVACILAHKQLSQVPSAVAVVRPVPAGSSRQ